MTEPFSYSITYVLDKSHFSETYDESVTVDDSRKPYLKAIVISMVGMLILYFTDIDAHIAWFIVALGGLDALSVRFQKPWWLARQMISKAANNPLTLTIDDTGVSSKSHYVEGTILWKDISKFEKTSQGWLLYHPGGKAYVSDRIMSEETQKYIAERKSGAR